MLIRRAVSRFAANVGCLRMTTVVISADHHKKSKVANRGQRMCRGFAERQILQLDISKVFLTQTNKQTNWGFAKDLSRRMSLDECVSGGKVKSLYCPLK